MFQFGELVRHSQEQNSSWEYHLETRAAPAYSKSIHLVGARSRHAWVEGRGLSPVDVLLLH
jgi:hypothetical protein